MRTVGSPQHATTGSCDALIGRVLVGCARRGTARQPTRHRGTAGVSRDFVRYSDAQAVVPRADLPCRFSRRDSSKTIDRLKRCGRRRLDNASSIVCRDARVATARANDRGCHVDRRDRIRRRERSAWSRNSAWYEECAREGAHTEEESHVRSWEGSDGDRARGRARRVPANARSQAVRACAAARRARCDGARPDPTRRRGSDLAAARVREHGAVPPPQARLRRARGARADPGRAAAGPVAGTWPRSSPMARSGTRTSASSRASSRRRPRTPGSRLPPERPRTRCSTWSRAIGSAIFPTIRRIRAPCPSASCSRCRR